MSSSKNWWRIFLKYLTTRYQINEPIDNDKMISDLCANFKEITRGDYHILTAIFDITDSRNWTIWGIKHAEMVIEPDEMWDLFKDEFDL